MASLESKAVTRIDERLAYALVRGGLAATAGSLVVELVSESFAGRELSLSLAAVGGSLLVGALVQRLRSWVKRPGRVSVEAGIARLELGSKLLPEAQAAVSAGSEATLPLASLERGYVEVDPSGEARLVLEGARERWRLSLERPEDAEPILAEAHLDARQRAIRFARNESGSRTTATMLSFLFAGPLALGPALLVWAERGDDVGVGLVAAAGVVMSAAAGILATTRLEPSPIIVGADGVRWVGWFGRRYLVRYEALEEVSVVGRVLRLFTSDQVYAIDLGDTPAPRREALRRRIEAAWDAQIEPAPLDFLAREGLDPERWRERLAGLLGGSEGYRVARVPRARVVATLDDPSAPAEQRLGAAIALTAAGSEDERRLARERAALLAKSVVDPALAEAFEEVARGAVRRETIERVA